MGVTYKFTLDFDVSKSIVQTGNNNYILKPVIRLISEQESGALKGIVNPASENVAVIVMDGSDTVASSFAPAGSAEYLVPGIPPGGHTVAFDPGDLSEYKPVIFDNILVSLGQVNEMDTVNLELK